MSKVSVLYVLFGLGLASRVFEQYSDLILSFGIALALTSVLMKPFLDLLHTLAGFLRRRGSNWGVVALTSASVCFAAHNSSTWVLEGEFKQVVSNVLMAAVAVPDGAHVETEYSNGHFRALSKVNGAPVRLMVDTGASIVMLKYEDAQAAGLVSDALVFDTPVLTANGQSSIALTTIDEISVKGVVVTNIEVAVTQPGQLHTSLLGMNFLSELDEVIIKDGRMIFRN